MQDEELPSVGADGEAPSLALDHAPVGLALADAEGRLRFANRYLRELLGIDPVRDLGRPVVELTHADDRAASTDALRRVRSGELEVWSAEKRYVRPDGRAVWAGLELRAVRGRDGAFHSFVACVRDVGAASAHPRHTEELKTHLGRLVGSLPILLYEVSIRDGRVMPLWSSPSIEHVLGYTREDSLDPSWWERNLHPDDSAETDQATRAVLTDGRVARRYRFRHADGSWRWLRDELCLQGEREGAHHVLGMVLDITQEVEAQEQRSAQERRFHRMMEWRRETLAVFSTEGEILYNAPSRRPVLGIAGEDTVGLHARDLIHPDDLPRFRAAIADVLGRPAAVAAAEIRARHADGSWRTLEGTVTNLLDDPAIGGILVNARDITDQRTAEIQLRQTQKLELFGELTAGIVHDLNNVLSVIIAAADLMAVQKETSGTADPHVLRDLRTAARSGSDLLRKLLAFGHSAPLNPVPLEVEEALEGEVLMLRRLLPSSIEIELEVAGDLPRMRADRSALSQILVNLATNARDAMPRGGLLEITAGLAPDTDGDLIRIAVRDTGCGMDPETAARVFMPFFSTKETGHGTGLGMPIVSGLVHRHGGRIELRSAPGAGTTFFIDLPATSAPAAPGDSEFSHPHPRGRERILFVDDVPELRRTAARILARLGYEVHTAEDGAAALTLLEELGGVDLVVSDGDMPRMHGVELFQELRRRWPATRFVLSSGFHPEDLGSGHTWGEENFLQKPWTLEDLEETVRRALDA